MATCSGTVPRAGCAGPGRVGKTRGAAKGKTAGPLCQGVWDHGDDPRLGEDLTRIVAMVRMASRSAGVKVLLCLRAVVLGFECISVTSRFRRAMETALQGTRKTAVGGRAGGQRRRICYCPASIRQRSIQIRGRIELAHPGASTSSAVLPKTLSCNQRLASCVCLLAAKRLSGIHSERGSPMARSGRDSRRARCSSCGHRTA